MLLAEAAKGSRGQGLCLAAAIHTSHSPLSGESGDNPRVRGKKCSEETTHIFVTGHKIASQEGCWARGCRVHRLSSEQHTKPWGHTPNVKEEKLARGARMGDIIDRGGAGSQDHCPSH